MGTAMRHASSARSGPSSDASSSRVGLRSAFALAGLELGQAHRDAVLAELDHPPLARAGHAFVAMAVVEDELLLHLSGAALLGALGDRDLETVRGAPLDEHAVQLPGPVDAFRVEDRIATGETAETTRLECTELRDAQRLDPDVPARGLPTPGTTRNVSSASTAATTTVSSRIGR